MSEELNCCVEMNGPTLDANYWNSQYISNTTGWDLGMPSPALVDIIDSIENKHLRILIPGCGNAYEAEYLLNAGFTDITLIDISAELVKKLQERFAENANIQVILGDFFELEGQFDLILEQTFFCAIQPFMREKYVHKMRGLLAENGMLAGLLFNRIFDKQGPPFGGSADEYNKLFADNGLKMVELKNCLNSVAPRANSEVFFKAIKINGDFESKNPSCKI